MISIHRFVRAGAPCFGMRRHRMSSAALFFLITLLVGFFTLAGAQPAGAQAPRKKVPLHPVAAHPVVSKPAVTPDSGNRWAPVKITAKDATSHAPFEAGDCSICHQNSDPANPGPVKASGSDVCLACHDDFKQILARKYPHPPSQKNCLSCHNPHNSNQPKLLLEDTATLCTSCHKTIHDTMQTSKVKHDALTDGRQCVNCHNPHGANIEHLLVQLPMQLCLDCHGKDNVLDHNGKALTNMKSLLAANPNHHGPIAGDDCSACHKTHGGDNFRLLTSAYPSAFYAEWDAKNYALCFGCHDEKAFTSPETTELTQFRDGNRNLHYVHTNKNDMGRTCRACHEVHASTQDHHIRESVPYGSKGWPLKINFTKTDNGGSCSRTCHATKTYNNKATVPAAAK